MQEHFSWHVVVNDNNKPRPRLSYVPRSEGKRKRMLQQEARKAQLPTANLLFLDCIRASNFGTLAPHALCYCLSRTSSMRKRRQYVKTTKCYHRLPTIEETEEFGVGWRSSQPRLWSHNVNAPEVDFEDCNTWGFDSLKAKIAKLKELRQTLEPPAKQLEEKIKQSYDDVMGFVTAKSKQVRAVQIVWPNLHFRSSDSD